jgi:hypothetical protein
VGLNGTITPNLRKVLHVTAEGPYPSAFAHTLTGWITKRLESTETLHRLAWYLLAVVEESVCGGWSFCINSGCYLGCSGTVVFRPGAAGPLGGPLQGTASAGGKEGV